MLTLLSGLCNVSILLQNSDFEGNLKFDEAKTLLATGSRTLFLLEL